MSSTDPHSPIIENESASGSNYDAVIVGGSLAGCATAIGLGRAGLRVAVIEKQPDPDAFKRTCSHFIQASGVPAR
ncbi:MAG: FAD-dependent oxidoreductase, partial [Methanosarcina sp.]